MNFIETLKVILLGIVEGITEWLPISSTGHMLLVDQWFTLDQSEEFKEVFFVVIQLGAILAVLTLFFKRMIPLQFADKEKPVWVQDTFLLWLKVALACVPGAIITILFDDFIEAHLHTPPVIASTLILYGIAFLFIESRDRSASVHALQDITWKQALYIGLFQVLSIIPGTSRSGSTILGALLIGVSRTAAAEFTFFLAVPVMFGMSALKLLKFGLAFSASELMILLLGCLVAFLVSLLVIRFLMSYVKRHDFKLFGYYRIALGLLILLLTLLGI